ncbi:MAG: ROK family transcriptional regulator [Bryobacteraceae bacterium]|nr:ROK family transcriptional regulator [Bryobacteraceae bacterium]
MPAVTLTTSSALRKSMLRQANERLVLSVIRKNPGVSRIDVSRLTGLSPSSVTYVVGRLLKANLLVEKRTDGYLQVGRKPTGLSVRGDARLVIAVEIAATESVVAVADLDGTILRRHSVAWRPNPRLLLGRIHRVIRSLVADYREGAVLGIGVAIPGSVDSATGIVQAAENVGWVDIHAGELLAGDLKTPIYCENNAKLSALAERWFTGSGQSVGDHFVFITLHGGLGAGVVIHGHLLHAGSPAAAEFGHVTLHLDGGRPCPCGNVGCWEQYAADFALVRSYHEHARSAGQTQEAVSAAHVVCLARQGNTAALRAVHDIAKELGSGLVNLIWALNPDTIVLGDYAAEGWDLIREPMMNVVQSRVAPYALAHLRIYPSTHGGDAALLGAVALVLDRFFHRYDHTEGLRRSVSRASA